MRRKCFYCLFFLFLFGNACGNTKFEKGNSIADSIKIINPLPDNKSLEDEFTEDSLQKDKLHEFDLMDKLEKNRVVIVPWGDSVSIDLDGDGKNEMVSMHLSIQSEHSDGDWRYALPVLNVNGAVFGEDDFYQCCYPNGGLVEGFETGWYILNIDVSDPYIEIGMEYHEGRDFRTCFLRYQQGEFAFVGSIETNLVVPKQSFSLFTFDGNNFQEPDWEGVREEIFALQDRIRIEGIRGDGTIHLAGYHDIIEEWESKMVGWRLENSKDFQARLMFDPEYLDYGELVRNVIPVEKVLKQDTTFYLYKDGKDKETVRLLAGTEIWFRHYYPKERWMEIAYDEGGVYKNGSQSAWFQVLDELYENIDNPKGTIRLPDKEISPYDCFDDLMWGG